MDAKWPPTEKVIGWTAPGRSAMAHAVAKAQPAATAQRAVRVRLEVHQGTRIYIQTRSPRGCAAPGEVPCQGNTHERLSKLEADSFPRKIVVTCKSPVGDISAVTLIRTDTTLDHSQKAEKVCEPF